MAAPPDDPDPESGMLWLNLIGFILVFGLLTAFVLLYGGRCLELIGVLSGDDPMQGLWKR